MDRPAVAPEPSFYDAARHPDDDAGADGGTAAAVRKMRGLRQQLRALDQRISASRSWRPAAPLPFEETGTASPGWPAEQPLASISPAGVPRVPTAAAAAVTASPLAQWTQQTTLKTSRSAMAARIAAFHLRAITCIQRAVRVWLRGVYSGRSARAAQARIRAGAAAVLIQRIYRGHLARQLRRVQTRELRARQQARLAAALAGGAYEEMFAPGDGFGAGALAPRGSQQQQLSRLSLPTRSMDGAVGSHNTGRGSSASLPSATEGGGGVHSNGGNSGSSSSGAGGGGYAADPMLPSTSATDGRGSFASAVAAGSDPASAALVAGYEGSFFAGGHSRASAVAAAASVSGSVTPLPRGRDSFLASLAGRLEAAEAEAATMREVQRRRLLAGLLPLLHPALPPALHENNKRDGGGAAAPPSLVHPPPAAAPPTLYSAPLTPLLSPLPVEGLPGDLTLPTSSPTSATRGYGSPPSGESRDRARVAAHHGSGGMIASASQLLLTPLQQQQQQSPQQPLSQWLLPEQKGNADLTDTHRRRRSSGGSSVGGGGTPKGTTARGSVQGAPSLPYTHSSAGSGPSSGPPQQPLDDGRDLEAVFSRISALVSAGGGWGGGAPGGGAEDPAGLLPRGSGTAGELGSGAQWGSGAEAAAGRLQGGSGSIASGTLSGGGGGPGHSGHSSAMGKHVRWSTDAPPVGAYTAHGRPSGGSAPSIQSSASAIAHRQRSVSIARNGGTGGGGSAGGGNRVGRVIGGGGDAPSALPGSGAEICSPGPPSPDGASLLALPLPTQQSLQSLQAQQAQQRTGLPGGRGRPQRSAPHAPASSSSPGDRAVHPGQPTREQGADDQAREHGDGRAAGGGGSDAAGGAAPPPPSPLLNSSIVLDLGALPAYLHPRAGAILAPGGAGTGAVGLASGEAQSRGAVAAVSAYLEGGGSHAGSHPLGAAPYAAYAAPYAAPYGAYAAPYAAPYCASALPVDSYHTALEARLEALLASTQDLAVRGTGALAAGSDDTASPPLPYSSLSGVVLGRLGAPGNAPFTGSPPLPSSRSSRSPSTAGGPGAGLPGDPWGYALGQARGVAAGYVPVPPSATAAAAAEAAAGREMDAFLAGLAGDGIHIGGAGPEGWAQRPQGPEGLARRPSPDTGPIFPSSASNSSTSGYFSEGEGHPLARAAARGASPTAELPGNGARSSSSGLNGNYFAPGDRAPTAASDSGPPSAPEDPTTGQQQQQLQPQWRRGGLSPAPPVPRASHAPLLVNFCDTTSFPAAAAAAAALEALLAGSPLLGPKRHLDLELGPKATAAGGGGPESGSSSSSSSAPPADQLTEAQPSVPDKLTLLLGRLAAPPQPPLTAGDTSAAAAAARDISISVALPSEPNEGEGDARSSDPQAPPPLQASRGAVAVAAHTPPPPISADAPHPELQHESPSAAADSYRHGLQQQGEGGSRGNDDVGTICAHPDSVSVSLELSLSTVSDGDDAGAAHASVGGADASSPPVLAAAAASMGGANATQQSGPYAPSSVTQPGPPALPPSAADRPVAPAAHNAASYAAVAAPSSVREGTAAVAAATAAPVAHEATGIGAEAAAAEAGLAVAPPPPHHNPRPASPPFEEAPPVSGLSLRILEYSNSPRAGAVTYASEEASPCGGAHAVHRDADESRGSRGTSASDPGVRDTTSGPVSPQQHSLLAPTESATAPAEGGGAGREGGSAPGPGPGSPVFVSDEPAVAALETFSDAAAASAGTTAAAHTAGPVSDAEAPVAETAPAASTTPPAAAADGDNASNSPTAPIPVNDASLDAPVRSAAAATTAAPTTASPAADVIIAADAAAAPCASTDAAMEAAPVPSTAAPAPAPALATMQSQPQPQHGHGAPAQSDATVPCDHIVDAAPLFPTLLEPNPSASSGLRVIAPSLMRTPSKPIRPQGSSETPTAFYTPSAGTPSRRGIDQFLLPPMTRGIGSPSSPSAPGTPARRLSHSPAPGSPLRPAHTTRDSSAHNSPRSGGGGGALRPPPHKSAASDFETQLVSAAAAAEETYTCTVADYETPLVDGGAAPHSPSQPETGYPSTPLLHRMRQVSLLSGSNGLVLAAATAAAGIDLSHPGPRSRGSSDAGNGNVAGGRR